MSSDRLTERDVGTEMRVFVVRPEDGPGPGLFLVCDHGRRHQHQMYFRELPHHVQDDFTRIPRTTVAEYSAVLRKDLYGILYWSLGDRVK